MVSIGRNVALGCCVALSASIAHAQEALYGKQPPPGSAFVRFMNATPDVAVINSDFEPAVHLGIAASDRIAPYTVVERAAERALQINVKNNSQEGHLTFNAATGGYVTIVVGKTADGGIVLTPITDQADFNQTKARLAFYNTVPGCKSATLGLEPAGTAVFADVMPGTAKSRTVNPVQATVRAVCSGNAGPSMALAGMEIGASYSIWLIQSGADASLFLAPDVTARYKP